MSKPRVADDVQQPMEYEWELDDNPYKDRSAELGRMKGFRQAEDVSEYMGSYVKKSVKPKQEIDQFMQWDKPREDR